MTIEYQSTLTCPKCGFEKTETMLNDQCVFYYECEFCNALIKPKPGDCCVFCSFGNIPCPPVQTDLLCCQPTPQHTD